MDRAEPNVTPLHSVSDQGGSPPHDELRHEVEEHREKLAALEQQGDLSWAQQTFRNVLTLAAGAVALLLAALATTIVLVGNDLGLSRREVLVTTIVLSVAGAVAFVAAVLVRPFTHSLQIQREKEERARGAAAAAADALADATTLPSLIKANRQQMEAYDVLARSQAQTAFRNSQVAMGLGLLVLLSGAVVAIGTPDTTARITTASLSAIGGSLSGFIARTFLRTYHASLDQLNYYFQQPLVTSYLLSAERLIRSMSRAQRDPTFALLINRVIDVLIRMPGANPEEGAQRRTARLRRAAAEIASVPGDE